MRIDGVPYEVEPGTWKGTVRLPDAPPSGLPDPTCEAPDNLVLVLDHPDGKPEAGLFVFVGRRCGHRHFYADAEAGRYFGRVEPVA